MPGSQVGQIGSIPGIRTPGTGPRGPATIDMRKPVTSVGDGSSVPYGAFGSFANSTTGVWGTAGIPASSLQLPITWYVRATGSNNNGGTSTATGGDRSGSDGVTNGTTTFTSASAAFTSADVGKGICINTGSSARHHRIAAVASATSITLDRTSSNAGSLAWVIGGAWADPRAPMGDTAVNADSSSPVRSGDTVYIGSGTYRAVVAMGASWTPAFNGLVAFIGDVDGSHTGDAGMVQLTAFLTNDKTAASGNTLLGAAGKANMSFSNILFVGGASNVIGSTNAGGLQNSVFRDCTVIALPSAATACMSLVGAANAPLNILVDRCNLHRPAGQTTTGGGILVTLVTGTLADYDTNIVVQNCVSFGGGSGGQINVVNSGTLANKGGGVRVKGCFNIVGNLLTTVASQISTVFPCYAYGNVSVAYAAACLNAGSAGQIIEDYNLLLSSAPRTNVTAGTHSVSDMSYAALFHFGQETQWGGLLRRLGEPMSGSPLLGFGSPDPILSNPLDLRGFPRPAGLNAAGSQLVAVGALERANTSVQATSPAPPSGTHVWQLTGPGYQDFVLPVDTSSTTVSCTVQRDTAYVGTNPQLSVLANGTIGVAAATVTDTGGTASNNTLTLPAFAATAIGSVTIRVQSNDLTGASVVAFSVFTVT